MDANGETYDCDDERNPHKKVETTEDIVERLEPVLGRRGTNDVFPIL